MLKESNICISFFCIMVLYNYVLKEWGKSGEYFVYKLKERLYIVRKCDY